MFNIPEHRYRLRAFRGDQSGAVALEFAFIAPLLFFAIVSLVELGTLGMMDTALDNALIDASRRIRTGRDDAAASAGAFEDQVCANMPGALATCRDRLVVSVQRYSGFSNASVAAAAAPAGQFDRGAANDIILVKANYRWPLITPLMATVYNRTGPLETTLTARGAFKNEPFQ